MRLICICIGVKARGIIQLFGRVVQCAIVLTALRRVCHAHIRPCCFARDVWGPNIIGKLAADQTGSTLEGAFASAGDSDAKNHADGGAISRVSFDASRCSSEYVTGASLQPSALQVLACIKI